MRVLGFMENLLAIEAETKVLLSASDRSYEQTLMQELLRIFKEAELLFGPEMLHINYLYLALPNVRLPDLTCFGPCG